MPLSLETRDLTIRFGGHVAVNNVSCTFRPGELTAIVGPNGAGKTTYFNLISGQLRASSGSILFDGTDITQQSAPMRTRAGLGRAFQLTNLFPNLTVRDNVLMGAYVIRRQRNLVRTRYEEVERLFPIVRERSEHKAGNLSGGQRRMV